jgi:hypothetical protein
MTAREKKWAITKSNDKHQLIRLFKEFSDDPRQVTFVLVHPPVWKRGEKDAEAEMCAHFARKHRFGSLCILYLCPYRAPDIKAMKRHEAPWGAGPDNQRLQDFEVHATLSASAGGLVIAAWGNEGDAHDCANRFMKRYDGSKRSLSPYRERSWPIHALGFTATGKPARPDPENIERPPQLIIAPPIEPGIAPPSLLHPKQRKAA